MSQELIKARSQLGKVRSYLKQEKFMLAVQALHDSLAIMIKNPLMRQEKEEFQRLVEDAAYQLSSDQGFKKLIPLQVAYTPGKEKDLLGTLKECLSELQNSAVSEAKQQLKELEERKKQDLEKGRGMVERKEFDDARTHFGSMMQQFPDDPELKADIGEIWLKNQQYEDAYGYLSQALEESPDSLHLYNRIGIALRKMGLFETAEKYYLKALALISDDANLYFNIGRLYLDWERWDKVMEMAQKALQLDPGFDQAQKMYNFAKKRA